jgi:hypothetical protein
VAGALALVLARSLTAHDAAAEDPVGPRDAASRVGRNVVEVAVAGTDDESAELADALRELLARLGLELRASRADVAPWASGVPPSSAEHLRARVFVDERPADRVDVAVSVAHGDAFDAPVGRVVSRGDAPVLVAERVAHVIHATLETLLLPPADARSSPAGTGPEQAVVNPPPAPGSRPRLGFDAAAFAGCGAFANGSGPVFGGGASLDIGIGHVPLRPSLWLAAIIHESFDATGSDLALETNVSSFRAIPTVQLARASALDLGVGAGIGVDIFHTIPRDSRRFSVELSQPMTLADPVLEVQLLSRVRVGEAARLLVGLDVDYDFGTHRYTSIDRTGNPNPVLLPWTIRPAALLGLCIPLGGASACAGSE